MYCPFCDPENLKNQKIFETKTEYVIYNIHQSNKGRCLVIPKRHVKNIRQLSDKEVCSFFKTVKYVSQILNKYLKPDGFNYGINEGSSAGQEVEHLHFHILPRFSHDQLNRFHLFHGSTRLNYSKKEMQKQIKEFKQVFLNAQKNT